MTMHPAWWLGIVLLSLLSPTIGEAGVAAFLEGCMTGSDVPARLQDMGLIEIDRDAGPQGPAVAAGAPSRRLWTDSRVTGRSDAFTGYAKLASGRHLAVCWHVSRLGESAAEALARLKRQYPPQEGSTETGTEFFYGGFERWRIAGDRKGLILGVSWPMQSLPGEGTGFLYVVRPMTPD